MRIASILNNAVQPAGHAFVFAPGAVAFPPRTQLEPDILVVPPIRPASDRWSDVMGHWLAVEVLSRSSRVYDREFKRDAYLALGVKEVWLVNKNSLSVHVSRVQRVEETLRDAFVWRTPVAGLNVVVDLRTVFAGIEPTE